MSDSDLGRFVKDKWAEILVSIIIAVVGIIVWNFQREVGEFSAGLRNSESRDDRIEDDLTAINNKLDGLNILSRDVAVLGQKVDSVTRDVSILRSTQNERRVATTAYGPSGYGRAINQCGKLSPDTKIPGRDKAYRWEMQTRINMWDVQYIGAGFEKPIPGVSITAKLVDGGKACEMEVAGDNPALPEQLQQGVTACVTVTVFQSLFDSPQVAPGPQAEPGGPPPDTPTPGGV